MAWILLSDAQKDLYLGNTQLSKALTINANDNAPTITNIVKHNKDFDFEFIVNDDIYVPWFQVQDNPDSINNNQFSRQFHKQHSNNDINIFF